MSRKGKKEIPSNLSLEQLVSRLEEEEERLKKESKKMNFMYYPDNSLEIKSITKEREQEEMKEGFEKREQEGLSSSSISLRGLNPPMPSTLLQKSYIIEMKNNSPEYGLKKEINSGKLVKLLKDGNNIDISKYVRKGATSINLNLKNYFSNLPGNPWLQLHWDEESNTFSKPFFVGNSYFTTPEGVDVENCIKNYTISGQPEMTMCIKYINPVEIIIKRGEEIVTVDVEGRKITKEIPKKNAPREKNTILS